MTGSLPKGAYLRAFGRSLITLLFGDDQMDRAAALTYYGILAIFPGLLVLIAGVSLMGGPLATSLVEGFADMIFLPSQQIIADGTANLGDNRKQAGIAAIAALVVAAWSATGYVGAFMRAANGVFGVSEHRPLWKLIPLRILITAITGLVLALSAFAIVFGERLANRIGVVFDVFKWPLLVAAFMLLVALLYWIAPHGRDNGFRLVTPGSVLATVVWVLASAGFAFYVSWFDSYNRTYGALGGVIIFLVWVWLTNVAVLLGADFDAELQRARSRLPAEGDDPAVGTGGPASPVHAGDRV